MRCRKRLERTLHLKQQGGNAVGDKRLRHVGTAWLQVHSHAGNGIHGVHSEDAAAVQTLSAIHRLQVLLQIKLQKQSSWLPLQRLTRPRRRCTRRAAAAWQQR